jgi:hypothetical protein
MACSKIPLWDWKKGWNTSINIGSAHIPMNYFSCGTYYFDGEYQVVKFPKGMQLYHGSGALANANVEFPAGVDLYKPYNMGSKSNINGVELIKSTIENPYQSVEFETSKFFKISPGWFGTPNIATTYSLQNKKFANKCGDKCINVYELKEDCIFLLLDNNFNIWKILNNPNVPQKNKDQLKFMFDLQHFGAEFSETEFGKLIFKHKKRLSFREVDLPFTDWLCSFIPREYAGYAANTPVEKKKIYFHLEFMFCNPLKWLKRNLSNPIDWQNMDLKNAPVEISLLLDQMSLYKSVNVDFHAGDLFEHSIWSLLFAEQLVLNNTRYGIPDIETQKKIAASAFIHDIGKMTPNSKHVVKRNNEYIYFSIPDHPKIGGDYIRGTQSLPILNKNLEQIGTFNINGLLTELGFKQQDFSNLAKIIDLHWELGNYINKWSGPGDLKTVDEYINHVGSKQSFVFFYSLIVVSTADVLASQPYGMNNLTAELNHKSRFFPFITNVPKKYRGGDVADITSERRNAFSESVLDRVLEKSKEQDNKIQPMEIEPMDI